MITFIIFLIGIIVGMYIHHIILLKLNRDDKRK